MTNYSNVVEQHGCIVCGRIYNMLVVYGLDGKMVDCTVTSPGGQRVRDDYWPLVACDIHTQEQTRIALANHFPDKAKEDLEDD
jgi:hypothetical protein